MDDSAFAQYPQLLAELSNLRSDLSSALSVIGALESENVTLKALYEQTKDELLSMSSLLQTSRADTLRYGEQALLAEETCNQLRSRMHDSGARDRHTSDSDGADGPSHHGAGPKSTQPSHFASPIANTDALRAHIDELRAACDTLKRQLEEKDARVEASDAAHARALAELQSDHDASTAQLRSTLSQLRYSLDTHSISGPVDGVWARVTDAESRAARQAKDLAALRTELDDLLSSRQLVAASHARELRAAQEATLTEASLRVSAERRAGVAEAKEAAAEAAAEAQTARAAELAAELQQVVARLSAAPSAATLECATLTTQLSTVQALWDSHRKGLEEKLEEATATIAQTDMRIAIAESAGHEKASSLLVRALAAEARVVAAEAKACTLEAQCATLAHDLTGHAAVLSASPRRGRRTSFTAHVGAAASLAAGVSVDGGDVGSRQSTPMKDGRGMGMAATPIRPFDSRLSSSFILTPGVTTSAPPMGYVSVSASLASASAMVRASALAEEEEGRALVTAQAVAAAAQGEASALRRTIMDLREQLALSQAQLSRASSAAVDAHRARDEQEKRSREAMGVIPVLQARLKSVEEEATSAVSHASAMEQEIGHLRSELRAERLDVDMAVRQEVEGLRAHAQDAGTAAAGAAQEAADARRKAERYKLKLLRLFGLYTKLQEDLAGAIRARESSEAAREADVTRAMKHAREMARDREAVWAASVAASGP